ncbi:MAG: hypothetical protein GC182_17225 [Rhodopseudomonas sp.]|nr:hypothetical protein [Rhodopseudomonas sp.]
MRTFYHVPFIGWLTKDAVRGKPDAKYYFILNLAALYGVLVYTLGYPFLIVTLLIAAALVFSAILALTATDLIDNSQRARRQAAGPRGDHRK